MSEQAANHEFDTQDPKATQSNIDHEGSVLEEALDEFNPEINAGTNETIKSEIDIDAFKTRIAELEGEVKQGEKFNADFHEAVGIDPEAEADTVGTVLQKGYSLNGRLLRPAMVRVGQ